MPEAIADAFPVLLREIAIVRIERESVIFMLFLLICKISEKYPNCFGFITKLYQYIIN